MVASRLGYFLAGIVALVGLVAMVSISQSGSAPVADRQDGLVGAAFINQWRISCSDTDGGVVESVAGTVSITGLRSRSYADSCVDTTLLTEWSCAGSRPTSTPVSCPDACVEGACINAPQQSLQGFIDVFTTQRITGWAYDPDDPSVSVLIRVLADGQQLAAFITDKQRQDVNDAFGITGLHGFRFVLPSLPEGAIVSVIAENDGKSLVLKEGYLGLGSASGVPDATVIKIGVPELMITGQPYTVNLTMRNTGTMPWVGGRVSLDSVNVDGDAWSPARVWLPAGVTIDPGQEYTFTFIVTVQPGKSLRLFSWKLRSEDLQQHFGPDMLHTWIVTDTPYTGTPSLKHVTVWEYIRGDPTTQMCLDGDRVCQTVYPQGTSKAIVVRNDSLVIKYIRNDALNTVGVLKDGATQGSDVFLRCLTMSKASCSNGPLPSMPVSADLPVLPASAVNRHLITEEGLSVQVRKTFWWNPINPVTCQVIGAAGNVTHSGKLFLLDSYDFGGDVGVQHDVLVYEGLGTDGYLQLPDPWGGMRLERYLFVKDKGYYQEDGIEDPDCRDAPGPQTCNGIYSRFNSFEPATYRWIKPSPVPFVEYCPNI